jgi:hypothetical protein
MRTILMIGCALLLAISGTRATADENTILKRLLDEGVTFPDGEKVKLPQPSLAEGLSADKQAEALEKIADRRHPLVEMQKKNKDAIYQFILRRGTPNLSPPPAFDDARKDLWLEEHFVGPNSARRVDLYFFVHGPLEIIGDKDFLQSQAGGDQEGSSLHIFTAEELQARKLSAVKGDKFRSGYGGARFRLFDIVEVSGSGKFEQTTSKESMLLAVVMDEHFVKDALYPNEWHKLISLENGKLGPDADPRPYTACGAYIKATSLIAPAGVVLIEYHLVFDEPEGWFDGGNMLSNKMVNLTQNNIRKFRTSLQKRLESGGAGK